ncbi:unnamed protein product [Owenia fusiformis]|uniref:Uncharacterized protein n=1 Tax=Owenia fusiformis TaxID=6347 RepID=A0A8J1XSS6_OWEFU|nr:unnamed protein product [Owenia fusiformis]
MSVTLSKWMIVLVTVDRYIHICKPLRAKTLMTVKKANVYIIVTVVCSAIYNIPAWIDFQHQPKLAEANCGVYVIQTFAFQNVTLFNIIYYNIANPIFRYTGPWITVLVLNIKMIKAFRKKQVAANSNKQKEEKKITIQLIVIVFYFVIVSILVNVYIVVDVINDYTEFKSTKWNEDDYFVSYTLIVLNASNSAINFLVYFLIGKTFRNKLKQTLKCW